MNKQKQIPTRRDPWARWAKIIFAIVVCATLLALAGCRPTEAVGQATPPATRALAPALYVDNGTGCHYLNAGAMEAPLTPRMDRDGKQVCK